ncbi:unnamed protein product [Plutella xylostella]|uniref:(diamondback moth) hypothetical protein n=1 Tax=Plutella xylostella TaxID=51655 RepID=A0A8S4E380_PLUXY|nr:unnamed protein product [Plutella xylostella]
MTLHITNCKDCPIDIRDKFKKKKNEPSILAAVNDRRPEKSTAMHENSIINNTEDLDQSTSLIKICTEQNKTTLRMMLLSACLLLAATAAAQHRIPQDSVLSPRPARVRDREISKPDEPTCDQLKAMWR